MFEKQCDVSEKRCKRSIFLIAEHLLRMKLNPKRGICITFDRLNHPFRRFRDNAKARGNIFHRLMMIRIYDHIRHVEHLREAGIG